ncbi:aspartate aminotransferase family protein [Pseudomonas sp. gcc21]|uniref:pyridoxal phosphate-dependent decarboxylase family protein n=1 Tax=Pseudomonas sp. gcc21 TaxID=2726989 RepID=UPI0014528407|nr:aspartate aminotransferase family protein [Pseudomonas sp. gcc21]QJD58247.1 aspartate aminotransferase family protein [Pseudomonas sp. gcc21]
MKADESLPAGAEQLVLSGENSSIAQYRAVMQQAVDEACQWLGRRQMYSGCSVEHLAGQVSADFTGSGAGNCRALQHAADLFLANAVAPHHPWCAAHLHCPTLTISHAAEVLINAANQSLDSWDQGPSATMMELKLIEWLRSRVGYPPGDAGIFTSGGTQSNLMGLLLARDRLVQAVWGRSVREQGLPPDAHRIKILCSEAAHFSIGKNMALLGLGWASVVAVRTTETGQIDTVELERAINGLLGAGDHIAAIVGTAGTTDAGAIDPLPALADLAARFDIWLHVDAAWGGALLLSARYRHWLAGLERADSITIDFHKHFLQPISCGAFLLRDDDHFRFIHCQAEYLNSESDEEQGIPNLVGRSLQTTRRADVLKLWMSLDALGTECFGALIEHAIQLASETAQRIRGMPDLELLCEPQLSSVLFRFASPNLERARLDELNRNLADSLFNAGKANIGVTSLGGKVCLKLTLLNPLCILEDIDALLKMITTQAHAGLASSLEASA